MPTLRGLMLALLLLLAGCSMRSTLDAVISAEDRAFAEQMVQRLRAGDETWLREHFRPDLWDESAKRIGQARDLFPAVPGTTEIIGFNISTRRANGRTERDRQFTLVTHGAGRWTVTNFRTYSDGGPDLVVEWNVTPHDSEPPELAVIEAWDRILPWFRAGLLVILLAAGGLIYWLVRRSRRRRA